MNADDSRARAFELLHERVRRWIHGRGWKELREIQALAVAPILAGERDVVISAATAGGKTEAAFLPIVSRILSGPAPGVQALYVSPLKALINDQHRRLSDLCRDMEVPVHRWHGDVDAGKKREVLEDPRGILQITPESLEALFVLRGSRVPALFESLAHVVVDELHCFLGTERGRQLQSLLHRLELALRRRVARVGLSATLGDIDLARAFLRPEDPSSPLVIRAESGGQELRLQVRGYAIAASEGDDELGDATRRAIAAHLFQVLRGASHLVFANRRSEVEAYADLLARLSEERNVPNEFYAHHGSLSKELREALEARLQGGELPVIAICTSTLELGIDIGDIESVAQIGVPTSVAALRQRLGRSGRRGRPSVLRIYVGEDELARHSPPQDRLREGLVQSIAACELLLRGWCEPPELGALHLSTLVHQVLALVAQHHGARADQAYSALCASGPFRSVDPATFAGLLRAMGARELLQQAGDGTLVAGLAGEKLVDHYGFFSVFQTPEEYRLLHEGSLLGSLPIAFAIAEGSSLVFAGRRWRVRSVEAASRTIVVEAATGGKPPRFEGAAGEVHDDLRAEMRRVYRSEAVPAYLDAGARRLLAEGRAEFERLGLERASLVASDDDVLLFPWRGDRAANTLVAWLARLGARAGREGSALMVRATRTASARALVAEIADGPAVDALELARGVANKAEQKFDVYLTDELLALDYASRHLDVEGAREAARAILESG